MTAKGAFFLVYHFAQKRLYLLVATLVIRPMLYIAIGIYLVNGHREILQIAQLLQFHCLSLLRTNYMVPKFHTILWIGHFLLLVAKIIQSGPLSPLIQSLVDIIIALGRISIAITYFPIAGDSQFASLGQVLVFLNHLIQFRRIRIAIQIRSYDTSRPAIAYLFIIIV